MCIKLENDQGCCSVRFIPYKTRRKYRPFQKDAKDVGCLSFDLVLIIIGGLLGLCGLIELSGSSNRSYGLILLGSGFLIGGVGGSARLGSKGIIVSGPVGLIMILVGCLLDI